MRVGTLLVVVSLAAAIGCVNGGCDPYRDRGPPPPPPPPCSVEREQALQIILPGCISFVFDEATGGPLTCTPGIAAECAVVDVDCVTAAIPLPVGTDTTLAIGLHDGCFSGVPVSFSVALRADANPAFVVLPTGPTFTEDGFLFLGVTPEEVGEIAVVVDVTTDARNVEDDGQGVGGTTSFRLVVDGIAP